MRWKGEVIAPRVCVCGLVSSLRSSGPEAQGHERVTQRGRGNAKGGGGGGGCGRKPLML